MAEDDEVVRTVRRMRQVVAPALLEVLTDEERGSTTTSAVRWPQQHPVPPHAEWPVLSDDDLLDDETLLQVRTFDDVFGSYMQGRETAAEMYTRFRSELQDFVADSSFGWGQLRP